MRVLLSVLVFMSVVLVVTFIKWKPKSVSKLELFERTGIYVFSLTQRIKLSGIWHGWVGNRINLAGSEVKAGFNPEKFVGIQLYSALACVIIVSALIGRFTAGYTLAAVVFGLCFPVLWINEKVETRQRRLLRVLPDVIDLMLICVESGLGFNAAIAKIVKYSPEPVINEEFGEIHRAIQLGQSRVDVLRQFSLRTGHPAVSAFVNSVIQGIVIGSSLAEVLKVQAEYLRAERFLHAEKVAAQAPVKILFPLMFFILPTVFLSIFAPFALSLLGMK
ncbi:MAG: type II secretion system F family protein [Elusimicrobiota bacterium]